MHNYLLCSGLNRFWNSSLEIRPWRSRVIIRYAEDTILRKYVLWICENIHLMDKKHFLLSKLCLFFQSTKRNIAMLFVRGDGVILVSPPMRTASWSKHNHPVHSHLLFPLTITVVNAIVQCTCCRGDWKWILCSMYMCIHTRLNSDMP